MKQTWISGCYHAIKPHKTKGCHITDWSLTKSNNKKLLDRYSTQTLYVPTLAFLDYHAPVDGDPLVLSLY